jgi:hypothetical protein
MRRKEISLIFRFGYVMVGLFLLLYRCELDVD